MKRNVAGQKRVTVEEVARQVGLSAMTVSRVLNNHPNVSEKTRKIRRSTGCPPFHRLYAVT